MLIPKEHTPPPYGHPLYPRGGTFGSVLLPYSTWSVLTPCTNFCSNMSKSAVETLFPTFNSAKVRRKNGVRLGSDEPHSE